VKAEERRAAGKKLRKVAPLPAHGHWRADSGRANPIDILRAADATRIPALVPLRYGRMLQSPFTFYRGSAAVMAEDLAPSPVSGVRVQACGDAHLMNFGGFATPERRLIFDINDLDETLPAPWEWEPFSFIWQMEPTTSGFPAKATPGVLLRTGGRPNSIVTNEPAAAYRTATTNNKGLIVHSTPVDALASLTCRNKG
jgi:hypothetical protein